MFLNDRYSAVLFVKAAWENIYIVCFFDGGQTVLFSKNEPNPYMRTLINRCTKKNRGEDVLEEEILVAQLREGSREAFDALYEKYKNMAIHTAYLITGNLTDSEDVVQETFVKVWLHVRELHNDSGFKPWMMQILVRTAYRVAKKSRREIPDDCVADRMEPSQDVSSLDRIIQTQEAEMIVTLVRKLPVKLRTVVVLYYYDSLSVKEIAALLGLLEGTVKSRLYTARRRLRITLQEQTHEASAAAEK